MVLKRRLDFRFSGNGNEAATIPRAPRSIRKKPPRKKILEEENLCSFELLAAVAGKLLEESEGSASCSAAEGKNQLRQGNEKELPKDEGALKFEIFDRGSCAESAFLREISIQEHNLISNFKGLLESDTDRSSLHMTSGAPKPKKLDWDMKLGICADKSSENNNSCNKNDPSSAGESLNLKVEDGSEVVYSRDKKDKIVDSSVANVSSIKDQIGGCVNTNSLVNSESSVKLSLYRKSIPRALLQKHWNNVKLGVRDDDENSFGCSKYSTRVVKSLRPQARIGQRRMRKMMTSSKYRKAAPKLKDYEPFATSEAMKGLYRYRKSIYARERFQQPPLKKRKLSDHNFAVAYEWDTKSENTPEKGNLSHNMTAFFFPGDGTLDCMKVLPNHKEHHVKVSIKSFKVPELYLEVPESATIGSLKRTVLEAVTAILGGGIRVGIFFQGKKVRDDNRTLHQAGISQQSNLDNLGFTLEPNFAHIASANRKHLPVCDAADKTIPLSPATPVIGDTGTSNVVAETPPVISVEGNELVLSLHDEANPETMALVAVSPMKMDTTLAVVPVNQKSKHPKAPSRRTRRPFSVSEVEALVEAVETLGTGRWRDVKMRAFENADHRTYVDLKDKWKTLVHTANISPQQRRGEPVPHELLSRVLSAHSYWSQNQSK
ncbi:hypothetical protein M569_09831, partial [Genlisea aurea]